MAVEMQRFFREHENGYGAEFSDRPFYQNREHAFGVLIDTVQATVMDPDVLREFVSIEQCRTALENRLQNVVLFSRIGQDRDVGLRGFQVVVVENIEQQEFELYITSQAHNPEFDNRFVGSITVRTLTNGTR